MHEIFSPKIIHIGMDEEDIHHYPNLSCRVFVMSPWCGRADAQDPIYLKSCENLAESRRIFEGLGG